MGRVFVFKVMRFFTFLELLKLAVIRYHVKDSVFVLLEM